MTAEEGNRDIVVWEKNTEVGIQRNSYEATSELRSVSKVITSIQAPASS